MGTGGTPSERTSLSLGSGAFQVYDESISDRLSDLLSHYFDHPRMYCFAQDWRGIQFFILDGLLRTNLKLWFTFTIPPEASQRNCYRTGFFC